MKKLFVACLCAVCCLTCFAQKKGDKSVGVAAGVSFQYSRSIYQSASSNQRSPARQFVAVLSPEYGFFPLDRFRVSFSVGFDLEVAWATRSASGASAGNNIWVLGDAEPMFTAYIGPSFSYYFPLIENRLYYTPEVGAAFAHVFGAHLNGISVVANFLAFEYKPTDKWGISVSIGQFNHLFLGGNDGITKTSFLAETVNFVTNASVGVRYYL